MEDRETLQRLEAAMSANAGALARLNAHLQSIIPTFVEETANETVDASTSSTLTIPASRDTYFRCSGIYVSVPFGTTEALLQLGEITIPIQNTTVLLTPVQRILTSTDARKLFYSTGSDNGGEAFVWLWGDAVPKYGKM